MKNLKVGIAGFGIVGRRRRDCILKHPNLDLVAVCDQFFEGSGTIDQGVKSHDNYLKLLAEDLDVLFVCMTNDVAAEVTIAGLELGLHVFCEKPPGRDLEDIVRVIKAERANPACVLMYGFNHRYHDSVQDALKIVHSGDLGKIINLRGVYGKSKIITFNQNDWRTKRNIAGGGVLLDQGIHMVDLMRLFAGEFTNIQSVVKNSYWDFDVEDNAYALMTTSNGVVGMLHSSATQWRHRFDLDISLERGNVVLSGLLTGTKSYGAETLLVAKVDHSRDNGAPKEQLTKYNNDPSWDLEIAKFCECILTGIPSDHGTSIDAYNTMKLVYQIYFADEVWRDKYEIANPGVNQF